MNQDRAIGARKDVGRQPEAGGKYSCCPRGYEVINGSADVNELRKDKKEANEKNTAKELVEKYYKKEDYLKLKPSENNVFISVPSTSGVNTIPIEFAERLAKDFCGNVFDGGFYFDATATEEAKNRRSFIAKLKDPSLFKLKKSEIKEEICGESIVIVVDDTFTSGETILGFTQALIQNGIKPAMALTLGQSTKELVLATEDDFKDLAKKISDLTKTPLDENMNLVKISLDGASQTLIRKAINESKTNRFNAKSVRSLLERRAAEIRRA